MPKNCLEELKATNRALLEATQMVKDLLIKNDALRAGAERNERLWVTPLLKQVEEMKKEQLQFKARTRALKANWSAQNCSWARRTRSSRACLAFWKQTF